MSVATYDPAKVTVALGGQLITGFAPGTFVEAHPTNAAFKIIHGCDGEVTRTLNLDRSGHIGLTLLQTSASNATLNAYAAADRAGGLGIFTVLIKDVSGGIQAHGAKAWVEAPAGFSSGDTVGHREWVIQVAELGLSDATPASIANLSSLVDTAAQNLYKWAFPAAGG